VTNPHSDEIRVDFLVVAPMIPIKDGLWYISRLQPSRATGATGGFVMTTTAWLLFEMRTAIVKG
jgi:hypothetical protein